MNIPPTASTTRQSNNEDLTRCMRRASLSDDSTTTRTGPPREITTPQNPYTEAADILTKRYSNIIKVLKDSRSDLDELIPSNDCQNQIIQALQQFRGQGDVSGFFHLHQRYAEAELESRDTLLQDPSLQSNEVKIDAIQQLSLLPSSINLLYVDLAARLAVSAYVISYLHTRGIIDSNAYNVLLKQLASYDDIKLTTPNHIKGHALILITAHIIKIGNHQNSYLNDCFIALIQGPLQGSCIAEATHSYRRSDVYDPHYWIEQNQPIPEDNITAMCFFEFSGKLLRTKGQENLLTTMDNAIRTLRARFNTPKDPWFTLMNKEEALARLQEVSLAFQYAGDPQMTVEGFFKPSLNTARSHTFHQP